LHIKSRNRWIPALLQEGSGIGVFPMPRGEVAGSLRFKTLDLPSRDLDWCLDHAALLKEGRNPPYPTLYVQSPLLPAFQEGI
jgi:hypothetical protein